MLPVPLNSSKITSSMRLPVSMSAVAINGKAAAVVDVARRAEKPFWFVQRLRVDAARQDSPRVRRHRIVCARKPRDRVEQDYHVLVVLHQPLCAFDGHFGHHNVTFGRFVEREN